LSVLISSAVQPQPPEPPKRAQQYIIHSTIPISTVAATIPKISATGSRRPLVSPSRIISVTRIVARFFGGLSILVFVACSEPTTPVGRFGVLDDVGQSDWTAVSVGGDHTCGLKAGGAAYCWGADQNGQLGVATADATCGTGASKINCGVIPERAQPTLKFLSISAGSRHTCGITVSREAYCWGANDQGQIGALSTGGPTPIPVVSTLGWAQISAGFSHTCAVRTDGALFCWGANDRGQLGVGTFINSSIGRVTLPSPVASVSAGQARTCARTVAGTVYCWGAVWTSREGGLEITRAQLIPQLVPDAPAMAWVAVGAFSTCGADLSGIAYCWEGNPRGEMGTGTRDGNTVPQRVAGGVGFVQLSVGIVQTCGVATSGAGYCWGDDTFGQLGVSPSTLIEQCDSQSLPCSTTPVPVYGRQQFVEISTGFGSHSCGVTTRGNLYCWGLGVSGQRGDGTANYAIALPILVKEPTTL
jgi:alpha-tubulin suppressor-like RCC1 family protein